jgi:large subunit ribosomal protein L13
MNRTYSAKPQDVTRKWYIIDASETTLGRLSTIAANILTGKNKSIFTKHIDCGDYLIVINADQLKVTGKKLTDKKYYRHSGYPGNLKEVTLEQQLDKDSTKIIIHSIRGMLPINKLRDARLLRLKVYKDSNHLHQPQNPEIISLKGTN